MPFHFKKAITQILGHGLPPPPLFCEMGDINGEGTIGRGIYSLTCVDIFSTPPLFYLPLCQSLRPLTFPFSHSLAYIWAFSETCSTTMRCMNSSVLTVKPIKVHFSWNIILSRGERTVQGGWEKGILLHSGNIGNMTQASVCYQSFACHWWHFPHAPCHIPPACHLFAFSFKPIFFSLEAYF